MVAKIIFAENRHAGEKLFGTTGEVRITAIGHHRPAQAAIPGKVIIALPSARRGMHGLPKAG
jgi:hypothetical protein